MAAARVALTIEQCWHAVPGGTAVAALGMAKAVAAAGAEVVGVSARHRQPPPDPWVPPFEVRSLPLPRVALYEAFIETFETDGELEATKDVIRLMMALPEYQMQ